MQQQAELRTGDIVYLNSGGLDLKVVGVSIEQVEVEWRDGTTMERSIFPRACVHPDCGKYCAGVRW